MNQVQLSKATGMSLDLSAKWYDPILTTFLRYQINTPQRQAHFLAQYGHETNGWRELEENGRYSAERALEKFPKKIRDLAHAKTLERNAARLFNCVYALRMGNGPEVGGDPSLGDGYRFRGRGLCHLTGRDNYLAAERSLGTKLLTDPDKLLQPYWAALVGGWFWERHGLNAIADVTGPADFGKKFFDLQVLMGFKEADQVGLDEYAEMSAQDGARLTSGLSPLPDPHELIEGPQDVHDITKKVNGGLNGLADRQERFDKALYVLAA